MVAPATNSSSMTRWSDAVIIGYTASASGFCMNGYGLVGRGAQAGIQLDLFRLSVRNGRSNLIAFCIYHISSNTVKFDSIKRE
jgi:hypothetical protein